MADEGMSLTPWLLSIGGGIITTLLGVCGKLWTERARERDEHRTEVEQLRHELAEANASIVELQREAQDRSDGHTREHLRDLRRLAGLSSGTSGPWPAIKPQSEGGARPPPSAVTPPWPTPWPAPIIREAPPQPRRPPRKKPRDEP